MGVLGSLASLPATVQVADCVHVSLCEEGERIRWCEKQ